MASKRVSIFGRIMGNLTRGTRAIWGIILGRKGTCKSHQSQSINRSSFRRLRSGRSFGGGIEGRESPGKEGKTEETKMNVAQESSPPKDDGLTEQLGTLERSVSMLSSEVKELRDQLTRIQTRPPITVYKLPKWFQSAERKYHWRKRRSGKSSTRSFCRLWEVRSRSSSR